MPHLDGGRGILLSGETISAIGTQVTAIALPLTAVVLMGASTAEAGVVSTAGLAAFAVCGSAAVAAIDRSAKGRVPVLTNFAAALGLVPVTLAFEAGIMAMLPEMPAVRTDPSHGHMMTARLTEGLRTIGADPMLRLVTGLLVLARCLTAMFVALEAIFIVRRPGTPPEWFALAFAVGGAGALIGWLAAGAVMAQIEPLPLLGIALALAAMARVAMSMLHGGTLMVAIGFAACMLVTGTGSALIRVSVLSAIQTRLPPALMGRVFGTLSTLMGAVMPPGAMAGGFFRCCTGRAFDPDAGKPWLDDPGAAHCRANVRPSMRG